MLYRAGLELTVIPLPLPSQCCDNRHNFAFFECHQSTYGWMQTSRSGAQRAIGTQPHSVLLSGSPTRSAEKQLEELAVEEAEVLNILTQVNVVRRECEIVSGLGCGVWAGLPAGLS